MDKKEKCLENLYNGMQTTTEIQCSKCSHTDFSMHDEDSDQFYDMGWRATDNYIYCPECAKKYLKSKKEID